MDRSLLWTTHLVAGSALLLSACGSPGSSSGSEANDPEQPNPDSEAGAAGAPGSSNQGPTPSQPDEPFDPEKGPACAIGLAVCSDSCVNLQTDADHCGGCGAACADDEVCSGGACATQCEPSSTQCGDACVELQSNAAHCGGCDQACPAGTQCTAGECLAPPEDTFDVAVYGTTPAGVAAAYEAGLAGKHVAIFDPVAHIGGLTAGGLSNTDFRSFQGLGGTWRDFMDRVLAHYSETYGEGSQQVADAKLGAWYEPKVARLAFESMLKEANVAVFLDHELVAAKTNAIGERPRVTAITTRDTTDGTTDTTEAGVFIDASYEGDLVAAAGNPFNLSRVQGYNFRLMMSRDPDNQVAIAERKPERYESMDFSGLRDHLLADPDLPLDRLVRIRTAPNEKADFNDILHQKYHYTIPGDGWSEGSFAYRNAMFAWARTTAEGFFYFLATDPELSGHPVQEDLKDWGYAADEYPGHDGFTPALYVREGRRMVGVYRFTSADQQADGASHRAKAQPRAVAIGDYQYSSHSRHNDYGIDIDDFLDPDAPKLNDWGTGLRDDNSGGGSPPPYSIPYGVIVPADVDGLLVPVAVSADRAAFSSLRMEPTWTALGQAAGAAAVLALSEEVALRDVDIRSLQRRLHQRGAITCYVSDVPPDSPYFEAVQYLCGHGLFQNTSLVGSSQTYPAPVSLSGTQWKRATAWHDVLPDEVLTEEVAAYWRQRFVEAFGSAALSGFELDADGSLTRGEYLQGLFDLLS